MMPNCYNNWRSYGMPNTAGGGAVACALIALSIYRVSAPTMQRDCPSMQVAVRNVRRDVLKKVDKMDLPEDDLKGTQEDVQARPCRVVLELTSEWGVAGEIPEAQ